MEGLTEAQKFFAAVVKLRSLQKKREQNSRDDYIRRECQAQEIMIDTWIKRTDMQMRERSMPRFFDINE